MIFHETIPVEINGRSVDVDRRIARIVVWLNTLPGVSTEWSCQGDDGTPNKPYVIFRCQEVESLKRILQLLDVPLSSTDIMRMGEVKVELFGGDFRYHLSYNCEQMRDIFIGRLKRGW